MKVCHDCHRQCRARHSGWLWAALTPKLLPGLTIEDWKMLRVLPGAAGACARHVVARHNALTVPTVIQFANKNFAVSALDRQIVAATPALHVFDIVHQTAKFLQTKAKRLCLDVPLHMFLTLMCRPTTAAVSRQCVKRFPHAFALLRDIVHADNIRPFDQAYGVPGNADVGVAYLHDPQTTAVSYLTPATQTKLERHRSNAEVLQMIAASPGEADLAANFLASPHAQVEFDGVTCRIRNLERGFVPDSLRVVCGPTKVLRAYLGCVNLPLVRAAATASWDLYSFLFNNCATLYTGDAALLVRDDLVDDGVGVLALKKHDTSRHSLVVQCLVLTVLQVASGRRVDRSQLRFVVTHAGHLCCYWAPFEGEVLRVGQENDAHMLDAETRGKVVAACRKMFATNVEFVFWLGYVLTGEKHVFGPLDDDALIFVF
jgi:hypothetical protein